MTARQIPFYRPEFSVSQRSQITAAIDGLLASGQLMMGPWRDKFEARFQQLTGCTHAVSVNSATTALQIALQHYDVKDREVLVPAGSFLTDVSAVLFAGGTPVLVDIEPETLTFDLADLERKRTARTKGLIWVHLTGIISSRWQDIRQFADSHQLFLIEDAAHAHGASIGGKPAGSLGDVGVFSFYPTKVVTAGTGGMLTTGDAALARYAQEMRLFGKDAAGEIVHLGNDWFLDEIRACVGYHHASELELQLERRRATATRYLDRLSNQPGIRMLQLPSDSLPSWYHFPIFLDDRLSRNDMIKAMAADGIQTKTIYRPVHKETIFRRLDDGTLGTTERVLEQSLCLPLYVGLADDDVDYICNRLAINLRSATIHT